MSDPTKRCFKCKRHLAHSAFAKNVSNRDGLQSNCRGCAKQIRHEYEARHADAVKLRYAEIAQTEPCLLSRTS